MKEENKKLFDQEILELEKLQGEERGADIKYLVEYVKKIEGEDRLSELKDMLAENYNFFLPDLDKVVDVEWISESIPHIFMVAAVRFFDWNENDIFEMGKSAMSYSRTLKMFFKYFLTAKGTIQKAADGWNNYYTEGKVEFTEYDETNKRATLEISDFKTHPIVCIYITGIMTRVMELATGGEDRVKVKEIKCIFKGDERHVFELRW